MASKPPTGACLQTILRVFKKRLVFGDLELFRMKEGEQMMTRNADLRIQVAKMESILLASTSAVGAC